MSYQKKHVSHNLLCGVLRLSVMLLMLMAMISVSAQPAPPKKDASKANRYSNLPSGYSQVGSTQLYYKLNQLPNGGIDIIGYYEGYYYSSTFNDNGYKLAVMVGSNTTARVDCINGTTNHGVTVQPFIEQQGELARICYNVTNANESDVVISLGVYADVMIGRNDKAPISRRIDTFGQTYGLTMMDGDGAQLCVLFGSGLAGVAAVSDFWFGYYYQNFNTDQMIGNYSSGKNYMEENGTYDSGMGWCWKNKTIAAGSTVVFSYLIGVGDVNLEPNSSFEVTPDDPDGWNDLSRPHRLSLEGTYESPAGLDGVIDYAVEDSEEWTTLTDVLASGETFSTSFVATFDPSRPIHTIRFRTRDLVGNTTQLPPIEYKDVSFCSVGGIEDKTYTGEPLFQENLTCDLDGEEYVVGNYNNNVSVGVASFTIEGVFPQTIGRKGYTFDILPQPLSGEIVLAETEFVYNGKAFTPDWQFSNESYRDLKAGEDYTAVWSSNKQPGTGILTVTGKNNYTATLKANIHIDKAPLTDNLFTLTLPDEDITYDEQSHGATVTKTAGVGEAIITYQKEGESETTVTQPKDAGNYTIYLEFADGTLYYGRPRTQVGTFSIYQISEEEWNTLHSILSQLVAMGWSQPWDLSQGVKSVSSLQGLTIEKGHVTVLNLAGQNLTGQFPDKFFTLPELKQLNLANNRLSGKIENVNVSFAKLQDFNISNNQLSGNIGLFANRFANLKTLNASGNCLEDVYPMIPATVTSLDISRQTIERVVPLHLGKLSVADIGTKVPTILLYDHMNRTFSTNISMLCTTPDEQWGMSMVYQNGQLSVPYVSEQNIYYGESGDTLNVAVLKNDGTREGSTFRISLSFDEGDSNFDGQVNVLDLQAILNYMFEEYNNDRPYNFTASNLWKDNNINVQDAVSLVNLLLDADMASANMTKHTRRVAAFTSESEVSVFIEDGQLIINTTVPVSAFDIVISTENKCDISPALSDMDYICTIKQNGHQVHLIGYSLSGASLPPGNNVICSISEGTLDYIMMADKEAQEITCYVGGSATNIQDTKGNVQSTEVYRIPIGAQRTIIIDSAGKKSLIKNE